MNKLNRIELTLFRLPFLGKGSGIVIVIVLCSSVVIKLARDLLTEDGDDVVIPPMSLVRQDNMQIEF